MISLVSCSSNGHSFPDDAKRSPWILIPRWADRLEAVGEIGIVRCYEYNVHIGTPLFTPNTPRPKTIELIRAAATTERFEAYQKRGGTSDSMMDHYYDKLLQISKPPKEMVQNEYLENAFLKKEEPLIRLCMSFSNRGVVPEDEIVKMKV